MKVCDSALYRIYESAKKFPERFAYRNSESEYTYEDFLAVCERIAGFLKGSASPVVVYGERCADMLCVMLGCYIAGRAYVPVEKGTPRARIENIILQTNAETVINCCEEEISFESCGVYRVCDTEESENPPFSADFEAFDGERTVYIIFTSGSTGNPKGVPINERNLASFVRWAGKLYSDEKYRGINILGTASYSFDLSVADIYLSLCFGNTLVSLRGDQKGSTVGICETFCEYSIDVAVMTPTFARMCLLGGMFNAASLERLKSIFLCGEVLDKKTAGKLLFSFPNLSLVNAYGPTEAACAVSAVEITREHIEDELALPVGKVGECACGVEISDEKLILSGDSVFYGYIGGLCGGHFVRNGIHCYDTGDLGFIKNGLIYCIGRCDGQIKFRGYRIELSEIESVLSGLCGVVSCAVVAKRASDGAVKGIRAYVCTESDDIMPEKLEALLLAVLPHYMIPKIVILDELPINRNGKIDRKKLSEM